MSFNKLDFIIRVNNGSLHRILYLMATLIYIVPIFIALVMDIQFSPFFIKASISIGYIFILIGKILSIIKSKNDNKCISGDIGILTGIIIAFIMHILR